MANTSPTSSAKAPRPAAQDATSPGAASREPAAVYRFGSISAAVFEEHIKTADGSPKTVMNVSLRRSFRDASGAWQHTHSLRAGDLLPAALALTRCYESIAAARSSDDERE